MATEFVLPDIGEGLTEAEIVRWLVSEGDTVALDQPIVEIETDKALMEIPTPFAGVVVAHGAPEGSVLEVGQVLVTIRTAEDDAEPGGTADHHDATAADSSEAAPIVGTLSSDAVDLTPRNDLAPWAPGPSGVEALPIVRRLASELGVDLSTVVGTGAEGRITRDDVRAAAERADGAETAPDPTQAESVQPQAEEPPTTPDEPPETEADEMDEDEESHEERVPETPQRLEEPAADRRVEMSKLRRTIAERMTESWTQIPHVTTFGAADVTRLMASRSALKRRRGAPVSIDAMVVKAVVVALGRHAEMTARLDGGDLVYPARVDVGVAVDTEDGLMVVVVEDPMGLDLVELTEEIARLSEGARTRSLPVGAFGGQSFTVSNIGAVGGGYGTPIVPHGTTGILSVGRAEDTPVARNGRLEVAPMMPLSLSYDHRVIDGAQGRRFLATVVENLEEPTLFLA